MPDKKEYSQNDDADEQNRIWNEIKEEEASSIRLIDKNHRQRYQEEISNKEISSNKGKVVISNESNEIFDDLWKELLRLIGMNVSYAYDRKYTIPKFISSRKNKIMEEINSTIIEIYDADLEGIEVDDSDYNTDNICTKFDEFTKVETINDLKRFVQPNFQWIFISDDPNTCNILKGFLVDYYIELVERKLIIQLPDVSIQPPPYEHIHPDSAGIFDDLWNDLDERVVIDQEYLKRYPNFVFEEFPKKVVEKNKM
jgi:hypothetical protein